MVKAHKTRIACTLGTVLADNSRKQLWIVCWHRQNARICPKEEPNTGGKNELHITVLNAISKTFVIE